MTVQTSYQADHGVAYAGLKAGLNPFGSVSKVNKAPAAIGFGKGVVSDGENGAKLPTTGDTASVFMGVAMRELDRVTQVNGNYTIQPGEDFTVFTHGIVWVTAAATVAKDEDVFLRIGATNNANFSNAAGTGATESIQIPGAKFLTGGGVGDLVKVSFGLGG